MKSFILQQDPSNVFFRCVEDSNEAIMITDQTGKLVYVNPAWLRIYGFTKEEALGRTPALLHSGLQNPGFYREMWETILHPEKGYWRGELTNRAKNGKLIEVFLTITPIRNPRGVIRGYMGIALDVTDRRRLETTAAEQDRLASIGLLASGIAHEVGTPLGVIRGRAELLRMKSQDNPKVSGDLDVIISQIDRISKLITSLLSLSRQSDSLPLRPVPLVEAIEKVFHLIGERARRKGIRLVQDIPDDLFVMADPDRLQQIFLNLGLNALQAIESAITNRASASTGDEVRINAVPQEKFTHVEITDTGCGISPENYGKIFKPFFTTKEIGEGTGLGLSIVKNLAHEMGGDIHAETPPAGGARFVLRLISASRVPTHETEQFTLDDQE